MTTVTDAMYRIVFCKSMAGYTNWQQYLIEAIFSSFEIFFHFFFFFFTSNSCVLHSFVELFKHN